jgi:hypothetical protein
LELQTDDEHEETLQELQQVQQVQQEQYEQLELCQYDLTLLKFLHDKLVSLEE